MKSLLLLWSKLAEESAGWCCTSADKDIKTVLARSKHEGLSFLTMTLPGFGKDFEKSLDLGQVARSSFTGFRWKRGLPRFLGGYLELVFDRNSGVLLETPSIDAILAVRQLTLAFGKMRLPCSDTRVEAALLQYLECEQDVKHCDARLDSTSIAEFRRMSSMLFRDVFTEVDRKVYYHEAIPKHGPGATADRLSGNSKYRQSTWTARLEEVFPVGEYLLPSWSYYDRLAAVDILEPDAEVPVRVTTVPKTLKAPRVIAMEPTAMMYMQQGLMLELVDALTVPRRKLGDGRTRVNHLSRIIGFDDQIPNQEMAKAGSLNGKLATLDLSDASDRVSNMLVRAMLSDWPHLCKAVEATRSRKAFVPGHGIHYLAKFASMGSALTFPVEAMVFTTCVFIGIDRASNTLLSRHDLFRLAAQVRVYGDDLIVPTDSVRSVVDSLQHFGAKVNSRKSFWTGRFRESCGKEYYAGEDVSVVRVREMFPAHRRDATRVISLVSLRNQLYFAGYWRTCKWLDEWIKGKIHYFPMVLPSSRVQGRHSVLGFETQRIDEHIHTPLVKGWVVSSTLPANPLDDVGALLKFFLKRGGLPSADERHLERSGRPQRVDIKLRYSSAV